MIDLIAGQRKSGIVFVCVHEGEFEGAVREECALAVRRNVPVRAGHVPITKVFSGEWRPAGEVTLELPEGNADGGAKTMDDLWDSLCAQAILDSADGANLDARIARRDQIISVPRTPPSATRFTPNCIRFARSWHNWSSRCPVTGAASRRCAQKPQRSETQPRAAELIEPAQNRALA